jgi:hypothetical protein
MRAGADRRDHDEAAHPGRVHGAREVEHHAVIHAFQPGAAGLALRGAEAAVSVVCAELRHEPVEIVERGDEGRELRRGLRQRAARQHDHARIFAAVEQILHEEAADQAGAAGDHCGAGHESSPQDGLAV